MTDQAGPTPTERLVDCARRLSAHLDVVTPAGWAAHVSPSKHLNDQLREALADYDQARAVRLGINELEEAHAFANLMREQRDCAKVLRNAFCNAAREAGVDVDQMVRDLTGSTINTVAQAESTWDFVVGDTVRVGRHEGVIDKETTNGNGERCYYVVDADGVELSLDGYKGWHAAERMEMVQAASPWLKAADVEEPGEYWVRLPPPDHIREDGQHFITVSIRKGSEYWRGEWSGIEGRTVYIDGDQQRLLPEGWQFRGPLTPPPPPPEPESEVE